MRLFPLPFFEFQNWLTMKMLESFGKLVILAA